MKMNKMKQAMVAGFCASFLLSAPQISWAGSTSAARASEQTTSHSRGAIHTTTHTYVVRPSDTLWNIARENRISVSSLKKINGLHSNIIRVGQHIRIRIGATKTDTVRIWSTTAMKHGTLKSTVHRVSPPFRDVPQRLIPVYVAAGNKYGVHWTVLAAIHKYETGFATSHSPVSSEGAVGPMQFMPATFAHYGVKAPGGHGSPNIHNVKDAIFTTAHMLSADGYAKNPSAALYCYNHSTQYVKQILTYAEA